MHIIRDSHDNIILVFEGSFEEMIQRMELTFGPNTYYNVCSGSGTLKFGEKKFTWNSMEKNVIRVPACGL